MLLEHKQGEPFPFRLSSRIGSSRGDILYLKLLRLNSFHRFYAAPLSPPAALATCCCRLRRLVLPAVRRAAAVTESSTRTSLRRSHWFAFCRGRGGATSSSPFPSPSVLLRVGTFASGERSRVLPVFSHQLFVRRPRSSSLVREGHH